MKSKIVISKAFTVLNNEFLSKINFETQRLHIYFDEFEFNFSSLLIKQKRNVCEKKFLMCFSICFLKKNLMS